MHFDEHFRTVKVTRDVPLSLLVAKHFSSNGYFIDAASNSAIATSQENDRTASVQISTSTEICARACKKTELLNFDVAF